MPQLYRAAYVSTHSSGVRYVNTFHVVARSQEFTTGDESAAGVRDALHTALTTKYRALLGTDVQVETIVVREELAPGDTTPPDEASTTINLAGTFALTTDRNPPALCTLATFYTNAAVRSGHGRMFLPSSPQPADLDTNGSWQTNRAYWTTTLPAFLNELKAEHTTGNQGAGHTLSQVVYSRTRRAAADPFHYFDVTSYTVRQLAHFLRSRTTAP